MQSVPSGCEVTVTIDGDEEFKVGDKDKVLGVTCD